MNELTKIFIYCLTLLAISAARGQGGSSNDLLMLYKLDSMPEKYVLCISATSPEKRQTSLIVMADTFSVQSRRGMCSVVMTNAYILQTSFGGTLSNKVTQTKMRMGVYEIQFPEHTKLVFNDSVVELPKVKIEAPGEANARIYEGEDALRQLKKMGLEPPDDMDMDKAVGNQKEK